MGPDGEPVNAAEGEVLTWFVVYTPRGKCERHMWKGKARNAHHACALAEERTGRMSGFAVMVKD